MAKLRRTVGQHDAEPERPGDPVSSAVVTGAGSALPATLDQDAVWEGYFARHYEGVRAARRIFAGSGVRRRHAVASPLDEDLSNWSTGARMERYVQEALPLGKQAVAGALDAAGLAPGDVGLFAVVTCTGYATPGLDIRLASDLGMPPGLQRLLVGHMGCYAAIPGLAAVSDFVTARSRPAVLLCCELTSLHVQPAQDDLEQVVAHALFSDAAAAVVVEPGAGSGRRMAGIVARTDPSTADHMTWDVTDLGFRMGLSARVPDVLGRHVGGVVEELLTGAGLRIEDVAGWAVHPGGPRILDVVRDSSGWPRSRSRPPAGCSPSTATARRRPCSSCSRSSPTWTGRWSRWRSGPGSPSTRHCSSRPESCRRAAVAALGWGYEVTASGRGLLVGSPAVVRGSSWSTTTRSCGGGSPRCWRTTRGSPWPARRDRWPRRWRACPPSGPTSSSSTCGCPTATARSSAAACGSACPGSAAWC